MLNYIVGPGDRKFQVDDIPFDADLKEYLGSEIWEGSPLELSLMIQLIRDVQRLLSVMQGVRRIG
jgi:hypothetical protein